MTHNMRIGDDVFTTTRDMIDVTSMHRPHVEKLLFDVNAHAHPWCTPDGKPATHYDPSVAYIMPSLVWVKDGEEYWEDDDESHEVGHYECRICGAHVAPRYTADAHAVYICGLIYCSINGQLVSREEFVRRMAAANLRRNQ